MRGDRDRAGAFSAAASWSILCHRESKIVKLPVDVDRARSARRVFRNQCDFPALIKAAYTV